MRRMPKRWPRSPIPGAFFDPETRRLHWPGGDAGASGTLDYFAFVEDVQPIHPGRTCFGPAEDPVWAVWPWRQGPLNRQRWPIRVRLSGIEQTRFLEVMDRFETLTPGRITEAQRLRRRADLQTHLGDAALPIVDVIFHADDAAWTWLHTWLRESAWCALSVRHTEAWQPPLVLSAIPEQAPEVSQRGVLTTIAPLDGALLERLRDIFSLAHVPDARSEGRADGNRSPIPLIPLIPPPVVDVFVTREHRSVEWEPEPPEAEPGLFEHTKLTH